MPLLQLRNITAPFRNKTHIVTIAGITFAFVAFRLAGGNITAAFPGSQKRLPRIDFTQEEREPKSEPSGATSASKRALRSLLDEIPVGESAVPPPSSNGDDSDLVDDMLGSVPKRKAPKNDERSKGLGLEDIEKEIGLR